MVGRQRRKDIRREIFIVLIAEKLLVCSKGVNSNYASIVQAVLSQNRT